MMGSAHVLSCCLVLANTPMVHVESNGQGWVRLLFSCVCLGLSVWPITGSAHGPNQPFLQPVNCEVSSLGRAKSAMYATTSSGLLLPKNDSYSNWEMGSGGPYLILLSLFSLI